MKNIIDEIASIPGIERLTEEDIKKLIEIIGGLRSEIQKAH